MAYRWWLIKFFVCTINQLILMEQKIYLLFGRSGCGKGTQAELLAKKLNLPTFSSGDMLRAKLQETDFTARKLKKVIEGGQLAPTFYIFQLWVRKFEELKDNSGFAGIIMDGSPRTLTEAQLLQEAFGWYEWQAFPILIDISRQEAENRLIRRRICQNCGQLIPFVGQYKKIKKCDRCGGELIHRSDDETTAIKKRLDYYEKHVQPAVDYYEQQGALIKINGEQPIKKVFDELLSKIENQ
ncbi:MAG: hypothetical protein COU85_02075 [Candidatus Portnoybacteria bacterium CG10_big_fil_rev_8_21_14_0_10_44_7]|uniref:Adenylate kinase n=1 Tax=Candidatus Portnoybacteria bacterium CG10_big_fil_rev_8_21_14_0_10_44_7 TaxID=1974816 RepID=A0A2M8KIJ0_9BACT|nr:MAG: hypothetical protein COU85_02075 [Candidatus Portnoybacteria bacterium CG10_big_fil_rev_8_21_14_0_10_44_7]